LPFPTEVLQIYEVKDVEPSEQYDDAIEYCVVSEQGCSDLDEND